MKSIKITDETHKMLKIFAATNGLSITALVEDAVDIYGDPLKIPAKKIISEKAKVYGFAKVEPPKSGLTKKRGEINAEDYL